MHIDIKAPTFDCIDMDRRLRGILLKGLLAPDSISYSFTGNARNALLKRSKELTPDTIDMLIKGVPNTFTIIDSCWRAFPEEVMERLIRLPYWDSDNSFMHVPGFIEDYVTAGGEKLLEKYSDSNVIVMCLLAKQNDYVHTQKGENDTELVAAPLPAPATYVKYYRRVRNFKRNFIQGHRSDIVENLGQLVMERKLNIDLTPVRNTTEVPNGNEE